MGDETSEFMLATEKLLAEKTLNAAGFTLDQGLMKQSISYYNGLIHFYDTEINKGTDTGCVDTMVISATLRLYCYWK